MLLDKIRRKLTNSSAPQEFNPEEAYDLWAAGYDNQPGNLMLALDEEVFAQLLSSLSLENKTVIDIGCGTGRHWPKLIAQRPNRLVGYDVSWGMLSRLKEKYPEAAVHQLKSNLLPELDNASCDVVVSTLTLAHIEDIEDGLKEWHRVLKTGGYMILTDYHPEPLSRGANRTFSIDGKTIAVKNHVHSLTKLTCLAATMGLELLSVTERQIDDSVKHFYEAKNALDIFEKFKGSPIIYGMMLKKSDATS